MTIVTIRVASTEETFTGLDAAFEGKPQPPTIDFVSVELLWKILTQKRWELLKAMTGQGGMSIREAARRVGRDVKAVHGDVHALLNCGMLERTEDGKIIFPYDGMHVDFMIKAA